MELTIDGQPAYVSANRPRVSDRPCVLLIHGAGQDHSVWNAVKRQLSDHGLQAIAVDLPGHGRSGGACLVSIEQMAHWIAQLIASFKLNSVAVVGHSMGSLVGLALAAQRADVVGALALVATAVPMPVTEQLLALTAADDDAAIELLAKWSYSPPLDDQDRQAKTEMMNATRRMLRRCAPGVLHADLAACNNYSAGLDHAAGVSCPTLMVLGEKDVMTPVKATEQLAKCLGRCQRNILQGAGHALLAERPDEVSQSLVRFL